jgi:hypothetical protein
MYQYICHLKIQKNKMKPIVLATAFIFLYSITIAQLTREQRIQDSVIGWWNDNYWDRNWKPQTDPVGKKKETHLRNMVEWMKKSYTPVGGLGTVTRYLQNAGYGVTFMVWNVSHDKEWTDAKGNFKPIPEENTKFYISVNKLFGAYPATFINKPGMYLFTWQPDGYDNTSANNNKRPGGIHPNAAKYITVRNEMQNIILAPGNKLPITPVTKGEYLQLADEALANKSTTANEFDKKAIDRIRKHIAALKVIHKNALQEPALLKNMQPGMYDFDGFDPFEISEYNSKSKLYYPLYRISPDVLQKLKAAEPQWVSISLPFQTQDNGNQLHEMYTAITENINYEYIYNYFFNPEKIKGIAYKPANEEQLNARLAAYRNKNKASLNTAATTASLPAGIHFMDDFSSATIGQAPSNWFFNTYSKRCYITGIKGENGKWVALGYNTAFSPSLLKKPLPQNFTLAFDLATDGGYTSRTGGSVRLVLNSRQATVSGSEAEGGNGARVEINITSGNEADYNNNNYRGEVRTKINASSSANTENSSEGIYNVTPLKEFTNNQNKAHVVVKVKNNNLAIFINNKELTTSSGFKLLYGGDCKVCGLPAGTLFNSIFFINTTNNADVVKVYISNVVITKD